MPENKRTANPKVFVLYENEEWALPLFKALDVINVDYAGWNLGSHILDLQQTPPDGIFYNKISASSHLRGNDVAIEMGQSVIQWLELHERRVINGHQTITTEISKGRQSLLLQKYGLLTPNTLVVNALEDLPKASDFFEDKPFILKPNKGGKGAGVQLFESKKQLETAISNNEISSPDGIYILQEYIKPKARRITRMEFIDGKFYYAVSVDTSDGFELCPADACEIDLGETPKFQIMPHFQFEEMPKIEKMLQSEKIDIAGIEYVESETGQKYIYDINTNTNYNTTAEVTFGPNLRGLRKVAEFLKEELHKEYPH